jgi:hypothetical protein
LMQLAHIGLRYCCKTRNKRYVLVTPTSILSLNQSLFGE